MTDVHEFLKALAVVLGAAAITTVIFQRLRQSVVLGYIIAGLLVGPHLSGFLIADLNIVRTLSELGVILFMFALGLEFSLRRLFTVGPVAGVAAVIECSLMIWLGFLLARTLGWNEREAVYAGAMVAISSTTIVVKTFTDSGIAGRTRELVVGILLVEDLIAILLITVLASMPPSGNVSIEALGRTGLQLGAFLVGVVAIGLLVVPRAIRAVHGLGRRETLLVASVGICFALAFVAQQLGYSVALGAFLAGSLVAESGHDRDVEELVLPIRDMFAAIFFVSVGMLIDPKAVVSHLPAIGLFAVLVIVGKSLGVSIGGFLGGNGIRTSVKTAMSLTQIGEFSFIIAGVGLARGAVGDFVYTVAVSVSVVTAFTTPWLVRASEPAAAFVDRKLPPALQTFAALYGSWIERLRSREDASEKSAVKHCVRLILVDAVAIVVIVIASSVAHTQLVQQLGTRFQFGELASNIVVPIVAFAFALPFAVGLLRLIRRLGMLLAEAALPRGQVQFDPADAPRRAFLVTLQLLIVLLVGVPMVALTQPFLPWAPGGLLLLLALVVLGLGFWRSATNLQGHVRAGAEMVLEALAARVTARAPTRGPQALDVVETVLPGLGAPTAYRIPGKAFAAGKTLTDLNLRGRTGATVLAIIRAEGGVSVPGPREVLRVGDTLALAGTQSAIEQAVQLLSTGEIS